MHSFVILSFILYFTIVMQQKCPLSCTVWVIGFTFKSLHFVEIYVFINVEFDFLQSVCLNAKISVIVKAREPS